MAPVRGPMLRIDIVPLVIATASPGFVPRLAVFFAPGSFTTFTVADLAMGTAGAAFSSMAGGNLHRCVQNVEDFDEVFPDGNVSRGFILQYNKKKSLFEI